MFQVHLIRICILLLLKHAISKSSLNTDDLFLSSILSLFVLYIWRLCSWKWKLLSHVQLFATPCELYSPWNSLGLEYWRGKHSLLQGIFATQGLNPGLPHCRQIVYQLSHEGSPWILEWVAYPFSSWSSWPKNQTRVSTFLYHIFGGSVLRCL